jgi:hypothetical protein
MNRYANREQNDRSLTPIPFLEKSMTSAAFLSDSLRDEHDTRPGEDGSRDTIIVSVDYLGADEPIHRRFPQGELLGDVKRWAQEKFVPTPPPDKAFYLVDDRREHRFSPEEERESLQSLKYEHKAAFRLVEEQIAGQV